MARSVLLSLACVFFAAPRAFGAEAAAVAPARPVCLNGSETREEISAHRLLQPFAVLKSAATIAKAEALSAKLCKLGDDFVYEIALLHHDGRLVHLVMNATTGKVINARNSREAPRDQSREAPRDQPREAPHDQPRESPHETPHETPPKT